MDDVTKANSAAQVIPCAEAIVEEVLRQHQRHVTQQRGTGVFRELWKESRNEADMVKDVGLAYRNNDANGREIYCPICLTHGGRGGDACITIFPKLHVTQKGIGRHLLTARPSCKIR